MVTALQRRATRRIALLIAEDTGVNGPNVHKRVDLTAKAPVLLLLMCLLSTEERSAVFPMEWCTPRGAIQTSIAPSTVLVNGASGALPARSHVRVGSRPVHFSLANRQHMAAWHVLRTMGRRTLKRATILIALSIVWVTGSLGKLALQRVGRAVRSFGRL